MLGFSFLPTCHLPSNFPVIQELAAMKGCSRSSMVLWHLDDSNIGSRPVKANCIAKVTWSLSWMRTAGCSFLCRWLPPWCDIQTTPHAFVSPVFFHATHACIVMCWLSYPEVWDVWGCADFPSNSFAQVYLPDSWKWNEREQLERKLFNPYSVLELSLGIAFAIWSKCWSAVVFGSTFSSGYSMECVCTQIASSSQAQKATELWLHLELWFALSKHCTKNHSSLPFASLDGLDLLVVFCSIVFMPGTISS